MSSKLLNLIGTPPLPVPVCHARPKMADTSPVLCECDIPLVMVLVAAFACVTVVPVPYLVPAIVAVDDDVNDAKLVPELLINAVLRV